jgi:hypothetical protein
MLRLFLDTAVPVFEHLLGGWHPQRTNEPKSQALRIGVIPDALGQLWILLLPGRVGCDTGTTSKLLSLIVP